MRALVATMVAVLVAGAAVPAWASFDAGEAAWHTVSTATLADPATVDATETACAPQSGPEVTVSWTGPGTDHDGFAILRSDDGGATFSPVGSAAVDATSHVDATVTWATSYVYTVVTTRSGWVSPGDVTAAVTTSSKGCRPPR